MMNVKLILYCEAVDLHWRWHLVCSSIYILSCSAEQLERARLSCPVPETTAATGTVRLFTLSLSLPLPS